MIKRVPRKSRGRLRLPKTYTPTAAALQWTAANSGGSITLTFKTPAVLNGPITDILFPGETLTGYTMPDPFHLDITGAGSLSAAGTLQIGPSEQGLTGQNGGVLAAGTVIF